MGFAVPVVVRQNKSAMARAIGLFCNNHYFPVAVPLLNSLFHNDVQARIKVYDHSGLNHLLRTYLSKFVDVVELRNKSLKDRKWLHGCMFRPAMLADQGFDEAELFLDADMVVLGDLEWPLHLIESGKFVCSTEWVWGPDELDTNVAKRWTKIVGVAPPQQFDVANGGLLGFNFSRHQELARLWARICRDSYIYEREPFNNDQMAISGLLESLGVERERLPKRYWMTTWAIHGKPAKVLGFNKQGKIRLYDVETGKPIQLYHYTGGIDQKVQGKTKIVRYYHARGESILEPAELAPAHRVAWKDLWEGRYRSPAGILAEYLRDAGPVTVPKVFSTEFRQKVATLLLELRCAASEDRVFALCVAYDYLTLLDYRLGNDCWLERPLRALLGERVYEGEKVLKWEEPADITLSFGGDGPLSWTGDCFSKPGHCEHLCGVKIALN